MRESAGLTVARAVQRTRIDGADVVTFDITGAGNSKREWPERPVGFDITRGSRPKVTIDR
jgi:hypothetical protein